MARFNKVPQGQLLHLSLLGTRFVGDLAQEFCEWLVSNQRVRYTTISNYLSGVVSLMNYVYHCMEADADALAMAITPLEMVINLRDQASRSVKEQTLYEPTRVGGNITWPEVQQTRVNAVNAFNALVEPSWKQRLTALMQVVMIAFMSLLPPDRVGVVRRLRYKHTLVKRSGGGWRLDLSARKDGHSARNAAPRENHTASPGETDRGVACVCRDLEALRSLLHGAPRRAHATARPLRGHAGT